VSSRRLNRFRRRSRAFVRHRPPLLATCGSSTQRSHPTRRILAALARGLGTARGRFGRILSASRDPFPPIASRTSFGCSLQSEPSSPIDHPPQSLTAHHASV
jgi:hypothetical protein